MLNILNVAQTGLKISQTQVENVMNNLANEGTPGYKKRVVNVAELEFDARNTGRGVQIQDVSRVTNIYLYQNIIEETGKLSNINQLDSMLSSIEAIFKETDNSGFSADLNRYFTSIENLKTSPNNEVYKSDLENNAQVIVSNLQELYKNIEAQELKTKANMAENVNEINNILTEIGNISQQISESSHDNPNDLLDKRDLLEKELSQYIDVEISRDTNYSLSIGGVVAVRFDTNVRDVILIEDYTPQHDVYARKDSNDGTTIVPFEDSLLPDTWNDSPIPEIQIIDLVGIVDDGSTDIAGTPKTISFLGTNNVPTTMGADAATLAANIAADAVRGDTPETGIIATWNKNHPEREIDTITNSLTQVIITYKNIEGDVPAIDNSESNGVLFSGSHEDAGGQKGEVDSLTYIYNNEVSLTVTRGEIILDNEGDPVDLWGDGLVRDINGNNPHLPVLPESLGTVTEHNALKAMMYKVNQSRDLGGNIKAYNGAYELADDGTKILTNDSRHSQFDPLDPNKDRYLVIESTIEGEKGSFVGEFLVNDSNIKSYQEKNSTLSKKGMDDIHLEIYEKEITISGGSLQSMINNLKTDSGMNVFNEYKEKLNQFAHTLSNLNNSYIQNADQSYVYGTNEVDLHVNEDEKVFLNLFSGADVKSLQFNKSALNGLTQNNLDYLATLQWKTDISFNGTEENNQSFSEFYQTLRVDVADNKENNYFKIDVQKSVTQSLENTYDKITKVDKDNEMIELIKFQSAYEANAKMITIVDEMLATLLGMKR